MGVARFIHLRIEREGLLDKDGRPTKKGIILYLQDRQRRGLDLDEPVPTNGMALSPQLQGTSPERERMFGHKVVLLNQRSCELTRRGTIKGAWFRCSGIRCVPDVRVLAPPKASHPFVSFLVRSRG